MKRLWVILFALLVFSCEDEKKDEAIFLVGEWEVWTYDQSDYRFEHSGDVKFNKGGQNYLDINDGRFGEYIKLTYEDHNYYYCEKSGILTILNNQYSPNLFILSDWAIEIAKNSGCDCNPDFIEQGEKKIRYFPLLNFKRGLNPSVPQPIDISQSRLEKVERTTADSLAHDKYHIYKISPCIGQVPWDTQIRKIK